MLIELCHLDLAAASLLFLNAAAGEAVLILNLLGSSNPSVFPLCLITSQCSRAVTRTALQ